SVKANSNLAVLALLARLGAGFDIVSGGELARVLAAGGDPGKTLFSGVGKSEAELLYQRAAGLKDLEVVGIGCHVGSLLTQAGPFVAAAERLAALVERLEKRGIQLKHIDVGGGIGIRYRNEPLEPVAAFVAGTLAALGQRRETVVFDPGRSIVGNAGILLTRVEYVKAGFLVVDAAM